MTRRDDFLGDGAFGPGDDSCRNRTECSGQMDRLIDKALRPMPPAPDLTRSIMGRLGYMRVPPAVARRQRLRRWAGRSALAVIVFVGAGIGIRIHNASPAARQPVDLTVPAAITNDIQQHQQRMDTLLRILRDLTPPATGSAPDESLQNPYDLDDDVNRSALGPVRFI